MGSPHCKAVFGRKFGPVKAGTKMAVLRELRGVNVKFLFSNPEKVRTVNDAEPRRLMYYSENRFRGLGCAPLEGPGKKEKRSRCEIWRIRGKGIVTKY